MTDSPSKTIIIQSVDTPPRVALSEKVKKSINESTNMTNNPLYFKKSQDTEDDSEDETYSFEQDIEIPSLMLDSKLEDSDSPFTFPNNTYRHASFDGINQLSDNSDSLSAQEALYTAFVKPPQKTRRSSSQADSILHALTPPSHTLKAKRFSKSNEKGAEMSRKRSLVSEYQKEFSSHSAVSPRFMTLRKLSEVTTLPSYGYPYANTQDIPPVPQIPSTHLTPTSSPPLAPIAPPSPPSTHSPVHGPKLADINGIIENQVQYHVAWRFSESQRVWEEQRNEAFGLAKSLVDRIEHEMQQRLAVDTAQCDALRMRMAELERQHEIDVAIIKSQQMDKEKIESRLKCLEELKLLDLKTQNKNLKAHVARVEQANRKLTSTLEERNRLEKGRSEDRVKSEERIRPEKKARSEGATWADIMESEDETKKNVELLSKKYRDLEQAHQDVCSQLKQEKTGKQIWKEEREQEVRQLKQVDSINRVQLKYLQDELKKAQTNKHCVCCRQQNRNSRPTKRTQSYIAKDGYLTFTAEMNGQLSQYSVKIPQEQVPKRSHLNPNAPSWIQA